MQCGSRMFELLRCKMIERRSRGALLEMSKSKLRGRRRMQRVSSESCWRHGLPGTTVRGLTARCSEMSGHGRRLCEKDAPQSCRTSWSADDDRRGVLRAMRSCMRSEMVGFAAPLLPVFELHMRRSAGLAPRRGREVGPALEAQGCANFETGVCVSLGPNLFKYLSVSEFPRWNARQTRAERFPHRPPMRVTGFHRILMAVAWPQVTLV